MLPENSGLKVHVVTSDDAIWNREMEDSFGVTEENISVEHIFDENRRLWFISHFLHLIKCLRNFFIKLYIRAGLWVKFS